MRLVLVHPPLDDPTIPYHSTAYLKGHLAHNGFHDVVLRDVNIEYVNYLFQPATVAAMYEEAGRRIEMAGSSGNRLGYQAQEEYYLLLEREAIGGTEIKNAIEQMRKLDAFLHFPQYLNNVDAIRRYLALLGSLSYPSEYNDFAQFTRGRYSAANMRDLLDANLGRKICAPFTRYFEDSLANDPGFAAADLLGISIIYDHQLYHTFHLARMLKERWPEKPIIFGGTAMTHLFKYMKDKGRTRELFALCDAIVVGEGETAICEIVSAGGNFDRSRFTNTITYRKDTDELLLPDVRYENVPALGSPIYDHPWDLYLSPERGINYSPTRGCYWNRCTFCDYGLNSDKPTSPWRERKIDQVIEDLSQACRNFGVRYVYFAVDVMAPGYLERLSDAILDAKLDIHWSAELRMERIFSEHRVRKMKQSGCVCVSFGMESGNQRILDLIDKGTKIEYMSETMKNFSAAGVACQLMTFTGFPTETPEEEEATLQFIRDNRAYWATGGVGSFKLTGTSIIAKKPEQFGIKLIDTEGADITRAVAFRADGAIQKSALSEDADASFNWTGHVFPEALSRPWAGGTDSLHSMVYYRHYGMSFFKENIPNKKLRSRPLEMTDDVIRQCIVIVRGQLVHSRFDLSTIVKSRKSFLGYVEKQLQRPAEPTHDAFNHWAASIPELEAAGPGAESHWLLVPGTSCVKLDKRVFSVLEVATHTPATVDEIVSSVPERVREQMFRYLKDLEVKGVISFQQAEKGKRDI